MTTTTDLIPTPHDMARTALKKARRNAEQLKAARDRAATELARAQREYEASQTWADFLNDEWGTL